MNVLVLHRMGDPREWRTAVRDLEFMLPTYAPHHNYIVHAAEMRLPAFVKDIPFHGIVLGPTFLCSRYYPNTFATVLKDYDFVRQSPAFKVAMPQDEYDCSAVLDRWMVDWGVNVVYSVCPEHRAVLYPRYAARGRIEPGYTGYIADSWIASWQRPKPFVARAIDVSYRASRLAPHFGRLGHLKGVIGDRFAAKVAELGFDLRLDISSSHRDMIPGERWHAFLEDSRFCLTTNSGSSLHDPEGTIRGRVMAYLERFPDASFDEVEARCFKGLDGEHVFTAISPRNLEAALAKTVQIATPGAYSGLLEPERHYIPLDPACANLPEVVATMQDRPRVAQIANACKEAVLSVDDLRFTHRVQQVIRQIAEAAAQTASEGRADDVGRAAASRYRVEVTARSDAFWARRRVVARCRAVAVRLGAKRLRRLLSRRHA